MCGGTAISRLLKAQRAEIVELERFNKELLEENDKLIRALDEEMVCCHLGVFDRGDDPKKAINILMHWSQGVGEYFTRDELNQVLEEKERFINAQEEELEQWETWGIVEIAVRNPNVAEYMKHWEKRAIEAEERLDDIYRQQSYNDE